MYDESKTHCLEVNVQGFFMSGVIDSGANITIMGGKMFKCVATVAKLMFKPRHKASYSYNKHPIHLDGCLNLDIHVPPGMFWGQDHENSGLPYLFEYYV